MIVANDKNLMKLRLHEVVFEDVPDTCTSPDVAMFKCDGKSAHCYRFSLIGEG